MACARNLGIIDMPIVCVNINGFYNDFQSMLHRAHKDDLLHQSPQQILHFEDTVLGALQWMEEQLESEKAKKEEEGTAKRVQTREKKIVRTTSSFLQRALSMWNLDMGGRSAIGGGDARHLAMWGVAFGWDGVLFGTGIVVGAVASLLIRTANKR